MSSKLQTLCLCLFFAMPSIICAQFLHSPSTTPPSSNFFRGNSGIINSGNSNTNSNTSFGGNTGFISAPTSNNTPSTFFGGNNNTNTNNNGTNNNTGDDDDDDDFDFSEDDFAFLDAISPNVTNNLAVNVDSPRQFPALPNDSANIALAPPPVEVIGSEDWNTNFDNLLVMMNHEDKAQFKRENLSLHKRKEFPYGKKREPYVGVSYFYLNEQISDMFKKFGFNTNLLQSKGFNPKNYFYNAGMLVGTTTIIGNDSNPEQLAGWLMYRSSQMGANVVFVGSHNVKIYNRSITGKKGFKFPASIGLGISKAIGISFGSPSERYVESSTERRPYMSDVLFLKFETRLEK